MEKRKLLGQPDSKEPDPKVEEADKEVKEPQAPRKAKQIKQRYRKKVLENVQPAKPVEAKEPEPKYDGIRKLGLTEQSEDGTVMAVPFKGSPTVPQKTNVVAPGGIHFHCCGEMQQTTGYTTKAVCYKCGQVLQLILRKTGNKVGEPQKSQWLPAGVKVKLVEDYQEQMTAKNFLLKRGVVLVVSLDHGVLPVDRLQEVLVEYTPSVEEWGKAEPPKMVFPVPVQLLERVDEGE